MESIQHLLQFEVVKKPKASERANIISDIFTIYTSQRERVLRKIENWKRYIQFLKENRTPDTKENQTKFKKTKQFIKEYDIKSFCFKISHIKTPDLYYVLSVGKDMENRNQNFSGYLMKSIQAK